MQLVFWSGMLYICDKLFILLHTHFDFLTSRCICSGEYLCNAYASWTARLWHMKWGQCVMRKTRAQARCVGGGYYLTQQPNLWRQTHNNARIQEGVCGRGNRESKKCGEVCTAGRSVSVWANKKLIAGKTKRATAIWDHHWKALGEENPNLLWLFL